MSLVKSEDSKKWINFILVVCSILLGFVVIRFLGQAGEWFNLEAKIPHFVMVANAVGVTIGAGVFVFAIKNTSSLNFLNEVFNELVKVVWPDHDSVVKITIGIVIGVSILSAIFVSVDGLTRKLFSLIY